MPLTDAQIKAFLSAHEPQFFSPADDMMIAGEDDDDAGSVSATRTAAQAVKTVARRMPVNVALGLATGAPGIVFGIGGAVVDRVHGKVQATRHAKAVAAQRGTLTLTCLACLDLPNIRQTATGLGSAVIAKTTQSPYVKAYLLMQGVDYNSERGYSAKTATHLGGGTEFAFREGTAIQLGFNHSNNDATRMAAVLIEVKDQPEAKVGKIMSGRDTRIGVAAFGIYQLVEQQHQHQHATIAPSEESATNNGGTSSHFINLNLYHGSAITDADADPNGGMLRLHVTLEMKDAKD